MNSKIKNIAMSVPDFLKRDVESVSLSEIHFEQFEKLEEEKEREIFKSLSPEQQKLAVRYISDTILCTELQRRLLGRKLVMNSVESLAESVKLTEF